MTYKEWRTYAWLEDFLNGLRVGQSYMNRVRPTEVDPSLYYEVDPEICWQKIQKKEGMI